MSGKPAGYYVGQQYLQTKYLQTNLARRPETLREGRNGPFLFRPCKTQEGSVNNSDGAPRRSVKLTVRLRPTERELLEEAAEATGRYSSQLARFAAVREARRILRQSTAAPDFNGD